MNSLIPNKIYNFLTSFDIANNNIYKAIVGVYKTKFSDIIKIQALCIEPHNVLTCMNCPKGGVFSFNLTKEHLRNNTEFVLIITDIFLKFSEINKNGLFELSFIKVYDNKIVENKVFYIGMFKDSYFRSNKITHNIKINRPAIIRISVRPINNRDMILNGAINIGLLNIE